MTKPGLRLPHVWVVPGKTAIQDIVPRSGFTLLCLKRCGRFGSVARAAFADESVPFTVPEVDQPAARDVYRSDYVLLRPDLHITWCGDDTWDDGNDLRSHVRGWIGANTLAER